eukprot:m.241197 g.241197  ORF g.241197 m.241197 type:complete len:336 (-) comp26304_c0_seq1:1001-2008(-)
MTVPPANHGDGATATVVQPTARSHATQLHLPFMGGSPLAESQLQRWREETVLHYLKQHPPTPLWTVALWTCVAVVYVRHWLPWAERGSTRLRSPWIIMCWPLLFGGLVLWEAAASRWLETGALVIFGGVAAVDMVLVPASSRYRSRRGELHVWEVAVVVAVTAAVAMVDGGDGVRVALAGANVLSICAAFGYPLDDPNLPGGWPTHQRAGSLAGGGSVPGNGSNSRTGWARWTIASHHRHTPEHQRWVRSVLMLGRRLTPAGSPAAVSASVQTVEKLLVFLSSVYHKPQPASGENRGKTTAVRKPPPLPKELWFLILEMMWVRQPCSSSTEWPAR